MKLLRSIQAGRISPCGDVRESTRNDTGLEEAGRDRLTGAPMLHVFLDHNEARRALYVVNEIWREIGNGHLAKNPHARSVSGGNVLRRLENSADQRPNDKDRGSTRTLLD